MLKKLGLENIIAGKSAAGVEIVILPDGSYEINLVVLKKEKNSLSTERQYQGIKHIEELAKLIGNKVPIVFLLNGKGIIHKKMSITENDTNVTLLQKVLPNANINDFNIQRTDISPAQVFVSIIRSDVLEKLMDELKTFKLNAIAECFLGPFVITGLLPLINEGLINNEQLTIANYQLQIREQQITDIAIVEPVNDIFPIHIGMDNVPQKLVLAFAGAFSYFTDNSVGINNSETINYLKEEFKQKRKFELRGWVLLTTTFIILIINYFVFNYYWSTNNKLNPQLIENEAALKRYDLLKAEYDQKKKLLEQNGLLENSRTSYYADRIASSIPSSVLLTELNIHPLKKQKENEDTEGFFFETKTITIGGRSKQSTELNNWMKALKKKSWISDVTLVNYKQDSETDDGLFLIELKLN